MTGHASPVRSAVTRAGRAGRSAAGSRCPWAAASPRRPPRAVRNSAPQPPIAALRLRARTSPGRLVAV